MKLIGTLMKYAHVNYLVGMLAFGHAERDRLVKEIEQMYEYCPEAVHEFKDRIAHEPKASSSRVQDIWEEVRHAHFFAILKASVRKASEVRPATYPN